MPTLRGILLFLLLAIFLSPSIKAKNPQDTPLITAIVLDVAPTALLPGQDESWEAQFVTVKLTGAERKNEIATLINTLTGHPFYDIKVKKGDRVLLQPDFSGELPQYHLADFSRRKALWLIIGLFILSVLIIGGWKGAKALFSLVGMGVVITTLILPLILKGYNPILVTVGFSSLITGLLVFFIGGYSQKTIAAILGTVGGLLVAGLLALYIGKIGYLTGLSSEEAQILQFMDSSIDFQGLLFSGIIIGALGAILDVGISIASAMEQIKEANPETDFQTLFTRGLHMGRDLIATMSNTLILAYIGSSLPLLLLFHEHQSSWPQILNLDLMATEIVRAMAGSIGLTLAIPLTAFAAALLLIQTEDKGEDLSG